MRTDPLIPINLSLDLYLFWPADSGGDSGSHGIELETGTQVGGGVKPPKIRGGGDNFEVLRAFYRDPLEIPQVWESARYPPVSRNANILSR